MESHATRSRRDAPMRQGGLASQTRDTRQRSLPTENSPAALRRCAGSTCEYQSDLSSTTLAPSAASGPLPAAQSPPRAAYTLDRSFHIRGGPESGGSEDLAPLVAMV